ncbi:peptidase inhibitor family I36 protein [Streptomyces sp. NPDC093591]|uniref:peptidase inhibitor family I36 protein n=1 Tax=Streptomyces sp. NPDC093591 TaxID=3366044 RepID=UPI003810EF8D
MRGIGLAVATAALVGGGVALAPAASAAEENGACESGEICLYSGALFTGNMLDLGKCQYVDLADKGWAGAMRSYDNKQTVGTIATFYTTTPLGRQVVATSTAPDKLPAFTQGVLVDGIQVC